MSNRELLARITTKKPGAFVLAGRVSLVAAAVLLVGFVMAEPLLAEPVQAKHEPKYVGDFYSSAESRRQVQIIDDGPVIHQYRDAPVDIPGMPARPQLPESQSLISPLGKEYAAASASSKKDRARLTPRGPIGDFPLKKLNFPREIGPAGKFAIPITASPGVMSVPAKPMRAGGAAQKGDASRLRQPTNRGASASPIKTYSSGYVPGSTSNEDKSKDSR